MEDGDDIRTIQEILGHRSVRTTIVYTHVLNRGGLGVRNPLDRLEGRTSHPGAGTDNPGPAITCTLHSPTPRCRLKAKVAPILTLHPRRSKGPKTIAGGRSEEHVAVRIAVSLDNRLLG